MKKYLWVIASARGHGHIRVKLRCFKLLIGTLSIEKNRIGRIDKTSAGYAR